MTHTNEVRIENSTECNYRCLVCPHSKSFNREKTIMSDLLFVKLLNTVKRDAPQITECTISGFGEAFMDANILAKIIYATGIGYNVHVLTNGSLCTYEDILRMITHGIASLRFSFHANNSFDYKTLTNSTEKNFYKVKDKIRYAIEKSPPTTKIIITAVLWSIFEHLAEELIEEYADKCYLEIWKPHNWVDCRTYREGEQVKKTCGRPKNGPLQIQVDGTINMCCFDYNGKLLLGDLKNMTLEQVFDSEMFRKIFTHHEEGTIQESDLICKNCDQLFDKKDILIYSNLGYEDRVNRVSTTYKEI